MPATARVTPADALLEDGHQTLITVADDPDISFWEKEVQPPGIDGGGENNITTMHNTAWRVFAPKKLKTLTPVVITAGYNPAVYDQIIAELQDNQEITVTFSDGSTVVFWGWVDKFIPQGSSEGGMPEAEITIIPSNRDDAGAEQAPAYTAPP